MPTGADGAADGVQPSRYERTVRGVRGRTSTSTVLVRVYSGMQSVLYTRTRYEYVSKVQNQG